MKPLNNPPQVIGIKLDIINFDIGLCGKWLGIEVWGNIDACPNNYTGANV
ncbi:MAG: hypothetical protein SGJ04_01455 [Bacteroidota bacterium]|nr:hypothetical protein [Bacteroidota bacterium]